MNSQPPRKRNASAKGGIHHTDKPQTTNTGSSMQIDVSLEERHALICKAAYLRAEQRGFAPGSELEDWIAAEAEIDELFRNVRLEQRTS